MPDVTKNLMMSPISNMGRALLQKPDALSNATIVAEVIGGYAGKFYNNCVYSHKGMKEALDTWIGLPFLLDHEDSDAIGSVISAEYVDTSGGSDVYDLTNQWDYDSKGLGLGHELLYCAVNDPDAAMKIADQRYKRVSAARMPAKAKDGSPGTVCSICGSKSIGRMLCDGESNIQDGYPEVHWYGETYRFPDPRKKGEFVNLLAYADIQHFKNAHIALVRDALNGAMEAEITGYKNIKGDSELMGDSLSASRLNLLAVMNKGNVIVNLSDENLTNMSKTLDKHNKEVLLDGLSQYGMRTGALISIPGSSTKQKEGDSKVPTADDLTREGSSSEASPQSKSKSGRDMNLDSLPTIYPTGYDQKLEDQVFQHVKELLGPRHLKTSDRERLPDNAFAGPGRTFPSHNTQNIQAGLYLLRTTCQDMADSVWLNTYFELRRREEIHGSNKDRKGSMAPEAFAKARTIFSLQRAGCLAPDMEDDYLSDPDYLNLRKELREDSLPMEVLSKLRGLDGIGPFGCIPADSEVQRKVSLSLLEEGAYSGPIKADKIIQQLNSPVNPAKDSKPESSNPANPASKDKKIMSLQEVLTFLDSAESTDGAIAAILDNKKVATALDTRIKTAAAKAVETKDAELAGLRTKLESTEKLVRDDLYGKIVEAKVKLGVLPVTASKDGDERNKETKTLDSLPLEALRPLFENLKAVADKLPATPSKKEAPAEPKATADNTETPAPTPEKPKRSGVEAAILD